MAGPRLVALLQQQLQRAAGRSRQSPRLGAALATPPSPLAFLSSVAGATLERAPGANGSEAAKKLALAALRERLAADGTTLMDFAGATTASPYAVEAVQPRDRKRKPDWMKRVIPGGDKYTEIKAKLRELKLHTVCEEARCPNIGECWSGGETETATATIMILGDTYQGSGHFAETIERIKTRKPSMLVEALVPDFRGDRSCVDLVVNSGLDVLAHNIETVEELQPYVRDRRANFEQSLSVLRMAKELGPSRVLTKTSIMLGCGETPDQVFRSMEKVRAAGVDVMTFGQYMRPSRKHMPVSDFVTPEAFERWRQVGEDMGFLYIASGPMVRSSYKAGEFYIKSLLERNAQSAEPAAA
eukprot:SM000316S12306  [mRNA]  locus=s316:80049:82112:- [translate_table: standard]